MKLLTEQEMAERRRLIEESKKRAEEERNNPYRCNNYVDGIAYHEAEINVYSSVCRSPWCPHCAARSPAMKEIRRRLSLLRWQNVRQIVLTVDRKRPPQETFKKIRANRAIAKLIKALEIEKCRWLWVLEFHKGGYPHWHVFIERQKSGKKAMIGKKAIQAKWRYGIVWETYAKNENHWKAISGYANKTGYFAGERKQHQLQLPDYLMKQSRVRKFAANFKDNIKLPEFRDETTKGDDKAKQDDKKGTTKKRRYTQNSYLKRLKECNEWSFVVKDGQWHRVHKSGAKVRLQAAQELEQIDYKTFRGRYDQVIDLMNKIDKT